MYTRHLKLPKPSFFLLGPRGTGKTTWVRHLLPRARVFDLLDESLFQSYLADPSLFSRELNTIRRGSWVVVDEVQRLPALLKHARGPVTSEERGPLLEGYVLMTLKAHGSLGGLPPEIYYWSPAEARLTEVDFLLVRGETKIALDVKASVKVREEHFRGLRAIRDLPGLKRRILVYLGGASQKTSDGIEVWPTDRFWRALAARGTLGL